MNEFCIQSVGKPVVATTLPPGGIVFYISRLDSRKTKSQFSVLQMDGGAGGETEAIGSQILALLKDLSS